MTTDYKKQYSHQQGPSDLPLINYTIGDYLAHIANIFPDNDAIIVKHQNIRLTYRQYLTHIDQLAAALLNCGIRPGDRVGIWSPNCLEWSLVQFATARIGAIMVCINPAYRPSELEFALNNVGCKMLIMAGYSKHCDYIEMLTSLAPELSSCQFGQLQAAKLPTLRHVVIIGDKESTLKLPSLCLFDLLLERVTPQDLEHVKAYSTHLVADDPINIQFTSGTTGNPKGATLSHHNILNNAYLAAQAMQLTDKDKLCIPVPLYHCFGMVLGNLACISQGACAVFPSSSFDPHITLKTVEEERCTALHGVPTMFIAQLEHEQFDRFDLSSLRTGIMAGSTCPEKVMREVQNKMHMEHVLIGYGQTECSPLNHITDTNAPLIKRVTTVGQAMAHTEVKIIDELGNTLPIGATGEVCARGYCVMQGYWQDDQKTKDTIDEEGWLHSGDLGVMDNDGYVTIVGRIKEMIIRGGENIYPREIEEVLYHHPCVQDAAVFGVHDEKYGEEVCVWLQSKPEHEIDKDNIRAYLKDKLAYFKVPKHIRVVEEYPMTVTGKLQKFKMRQSMEQELIES
ncbi:AMP-binding protein [Pseudoalteromonas luteoviolacea]|uniref:AMP-binding protein n=1 Tax=Pseudoalteromonas luteoviolacea TaxID=43657 RepID=UPI001F21135E|nr:AMP-binding protein [Pseudoalteromonas luteoviolacea]MCF6442379.1 AMP-binding protein [Pseudoalteromonas luteoviolacea]